jgi:phage replication-related protein YjqB (UPF0714/DUF867 family)
MAIFAGSVKRAFSSQSTLIDQGEHCSLDPERIASIGITEGSQLRVKRTADQFGLYTVSETRQESAESTVRMALPARQRLKAIDEFEATIDTQVPHPTLSDEEAEACSEFVERLDDNGYAQGLAAIAPHGGAIERLTDSQAERVGATLGSDLASVWRCRGYKVGGGAFTCWHIKSVDTSSNSFPLLKTIASRGFAHAVAFHGFSEEDVLIGGGAPLAFKREIAAAVQEVLGSAIPVRVATPADNYDGDSPRNIVNRLTAGGVNGVQIEQSLEARDKFWRPIADAVASVYSAKLQHYSYGKVQ